MAKLHLSAGTVNKLPLAQAGQQLYWDTKLEGFGLRVGMTRKAYFVEKRVAGRHVRHSIGVHGQPTADGQALTADRARDLAMVKLGELTAGKDLNAEKKAAAVAREAGKAHRVAAAEYTVRALCELYVKHQEGKGKESAGDAENLFKNHVLTSEFADLPAREFTAKQATALLRRVVEQGKLRTAAKVRAYLRAAYALAQGADTNAEAPAAALLFNVETNPIASTGALSAGNKTRDVVLAETELGAAMRLLAQRRAAAYDDALAAIELSVVLGGQRLAQVLRIAPADVDADAWTVTLWDGKGRRQTARRHVLPVPKGAQALVKDILAHRRGDGWVFGDKSAATTPDTVARKGGELLQEAAGRAVQPRDLRRTAETLMAGMGISKDLRAQLQSHGLGGVQDRHYDRHDYLAEKRKALEAWTKKLQALAENRPAPSNVKTLRRA